MRRTTTLTTLLLGAALLAPTGASAAGETCRGEAATIVAVNGEDVRGTEGRDVVVARNSDVITTGAGDDLVCFEGADTKPDVTRGVRINTGDGNDLVDATFAPRGWPVDLALGAGADEFAGGAGSDVVTSGPVGETDVDIIRGGDGSDTLFTRGGADEVYGDRSPDTVVVPSASDAVLDGGEGRDEISLPLNGGNWLVKLASGALRDNVQTHRWTSMERLTAHHVNGHAVIKGTSGPDEVTVLPARGAQPLLDVATGKGDDSFFLLGGLEDTSGIELGAGRDDVSLHHDGDLSLFLRSGTLLMGGVANVGGVEDARAFGRRTVLIGTKGPNTLRAGQCSTMIRGLGGNDDLSRGRSNATGVSCKGIPKASEIHGGAGRDVCAAAGVRTKCERR